MVDWHGISKKLTYDEEVQQKIFQYSKGISPLKKVTDSEKTEEILKIV